MKVYDIKVVYRIEYKDTRNVIIPAEDEAQARKRAMESIKNSSLTYQLSRKDSIVVTIADMPTVIEVIKEEKLLRTRLTALQKPIIDRMKNTNCTLIYNPRRNGWYFSDHIVEEEYISTDANNVSIKSLVRKGYLVPVEENEEFKVQVALGTMKQGWRLKLSGLHKK